MAGEETHLLSLQEMKLGSLGALMHVCKGTVGTGILGLPWAMEHAGIVLGPFVMVALGLINLHCMLILVSSARHLSKILNVSPPDYGDMAYLSFLHSPYQKIQSHAGKARFFVNLCLQMTQLGLCCTYTVFVAQNLRQTLAVHFPSVPGDRAFMAMLCLPFIIVSLIPNLAILAWFSTIANISGIASICIILKEVAPNLPPIESRTFVADGTGFAIFIGATVGAFEGIPVILPVANAMENPKNYPRIIIIGISIIMFLYVGMAFIGLLKFGPKICGSITLNLPFHSGFSDAARLLYCVAMFFTFPLQFYVAMAIMDTWTDTKFDSKAWWCPIMMRIFFVVLICAISILLPFIGDLNSLIGATSSTMLVILLPPLLHIMVHNIRIPIVTNDEANNEKQALVPTESTDDEEHELSKFQLIKNVLIIIIAIAAFFSGLTQTIISIIDETKHYNSSQRCSGGTGSYHSSIEHYISDNLTATVTNVRNNTFP